MKRLEKRRHLIINPLLCHRHASGKKVIFPKGCLWQGVCLMVLVMVFSTDMLAWQQHSESSIIAEGFQNATSIYATQNHLYVVESGKNRILKLDHSGDLIETMGGLGSGNYQLDTPIDLDATNGLKIYISDYRNGRVQIFDRRFQYLSTITGKRAFGRDQEIRPTQLVVNDFGELFFYDDVSKSIQKHDENGNWQASFKVPGGLVISNMKLRGDQLELIDTRHQKVQLMSQNGIFGEEYPYAVLPVSIVDSAETSKYYFNLYEDRIVRERSVD